MWASRSSPRRGRALVLGTGLAMVLTHSWAGTPASGLGLLLAALAAGRADDALRPAAPEGASLQARVTDPWRTRGGLSLDSGGRCVRLAVEPHPLAGRQVVLHQPRPGGRAASPRVRCLFSEPGDATAQLSALPEDIVRTGAGTVGAGLLRRLRERGLGTCARHPVRTPLGCSQRSCSATSRLPAAAPVCSHGPGRATARPLRTARRAARGAARRIARAMAAIATFAASGRAPPRRSSGAAGAPRGGLRPPVRRWRPGEPRRARAGLRGARTASAGTSPAQSWISSGWRS